MFITKFSSILLTIINITDVNNDKENLWIHFDFSTLFIRYGISATYFDNNTRGNARILTLYRI